MTARPFEVLAHTADTGITTTAASLSDVIANAAYAMFALMYDLADEATAASTEVRVEAPTPEDLLVDVLAELLYRSEVEGVAYRTFTVRVDGSDAHVVAAGSPSADLELRGPPIKAVTYHDLRCERVGEQWEARVIFDV